MGNDANIKQLGGTATTTIGSCFLYNICINKTLTGTLAVKEGSNTVATFAIGTTPGNYHQHAGGVRYGSLSLVLSAGDDVSVLTKAA